MAFVFTLPIDGQYPPALAVIDELEGIDAPLERLPVSFTVTGFVHAPHLSHVIELFYFVRDRAFKEPFFQKDGLRSLDVILNRHTSCSDSRVRTAPTRNQPCVLIEQ